MKGKVKRRTQEDYQRNVVEGKTLPLDHKKMEFLRIEAPGKQAGIIIDGHDITKYVRNIKLEFGVDNRVPIVTLELVPLVVEIPEEIIGVLEHNYYPVEDLSLHYK